MRGVAVVAAAAVLGCGGPPRTPELRQMSDTYVFRVSSDPMPPRAREDVLYKVVIADKESRAPIENGEGQIYASSRDGVHVYDPLAAGPELGTYYGRLSFITAGDWAVAVRFRRDSTRALETVNWMQDVLAAQGEQQ
jgi:hypothetical protein